MQMPPNMYGLKEMKVVRFIIQETGTYNEQHKRPYNTNIDHAIQNTILETVEQKKSITPTALAGVAGIFITPSATPEGTVNIINGWGMKRYRFMMEVQTVDRTGFMVVKEFITGYTDHMEGISYGGAADPNMRFFINSVHSAKESIQNTPLGTQRHLSVLDSAHVLVNDQYVNMLSGGQMYGLRPEDIYDQIDNRGLTSEDQNLGMIMDGRSVISSKASKSNRANAVAPVYMAKVLDSYLQIARTQKDDSQKLIMETARSTVDSGAVTADPFMNFVRTCDGAGNTFTLAELNRMDPMARPTPVPMNDQLRGTLHYAGQTTGWGGSNYETIWATTISQSLPSYMLSQGISKLHITATNYDTTGQTSITVVNVRSFSVGVDFSREVQALLYRVEHELLKNLTQGMFRYAMEVDCDALGDTHVNVGLDGAPMQPFVMPSFCDALMAPVTTNNFKVLDRAANDFDQLMTDIYEQDAAAGPGGIMRTGLI